MKSLILLTILTLSSVTYAQTPSVKQTVSRNITNWLQLDGQWYPCHIDSSKFILYNQATSSTPSTIGQVTYAIIHDASYPFRAYTPTPFAIPDVSGDGKEDIGFGFVDINSLVIPDIFLINGATGAKVFQWPRSSGFTAVPFIGDVDGDGKNEIVIGDYTGWTIYSTNGISTGITQKGQNFPTTIRLEQNYPNPFNPSTIISYSLPSSSSVVLKLYDLQGREVKTLVNEQQSAGNHQVPLSATGLASGVYFYQLQAGDKVQAKKLALIK